MSDRPVVVTKEHWRETREADAAMRDSERERGRDEEPLDGVTTKRRYVLKYI